MPWYPAMREAGNAVGCLGWKSHLSFPKRCQRHGAGKVILRTLSRDSRCDIDGVVSDPGERGGGFIFGNRLGWFISGGKIEVTLPLRRQNWRFSSPVQKAKVLSIPVRPAPYPSFDQQESSKVVC
jgi:hypothetical protein